MNRQTYPDRAKPRGPNVWVRQSEARDTRDRLSASLKGWWKIVHPIKAWSLYRARRAVSEASRKANNRRLVKRRLADPLLAKLNMEQRLAVIVQEDRTLIVAGAGTGKTYTMVAKARDTARTGIARPSQIAFVTFTRKAAEEIRSRSAGLEEMEIGTLHHLARLVIQMAEGARPRLSPLAEDETARLEKIEAWLMEAVQQDHGLLLDLAIRRQAFERCGSPSDEAPQAVRVPPDRVRVRSMGEALIATTLHLARVPYWYEAEFPLPEEHESKSRGGYFPDFYLPDEPNMPVSIHGGIWLEHFANDANGKLPQRWDEDEPGATAEYRRARRWKEELHASLGTRFVWTEFGDIQRCLQDGTSFPDLLLGRIAEQGGNRFVTPSTWDVKAEIDRLKAEETAARHWRIAYEIDAWIRSSRQQVKSDLALNAAIAGRDTAEETAALFRLARPVLERYEKHLDETNTVDHEGTILNAWRYLRAGVVEAPWTVILVDEYQDVNPAQAAFIHALLELGRSGQRSSGARLTAVGDDWQAIFGFQGGDVDLIRRFNDPAGAYKGFKERTELKRTYRFGQPIADTTRRFVTRSPGAIDREIVGSPELSPDPRWPSSIVIGSSRLTAAGERRFGTSQEGLTAGVLAALARIEEQSEDAEVLIVARRNADLEKTKDNGNQGVGIDRSTINRAATGSSIRLTYSTVHKAKGTQADYVILLDTGLPRAGEAAANRVLERALRVFRGQNSVADEERRIWYVALTRARRKVYVIVAADTHSHSSFADELYYNEQGHYDVGEDELAELLEPMRPLVPCPACRQRGPTRAVLAMREGHNGQFAGCTSYGSGSDHHCGHTERVCDRCREGLMIRIGNGRARCQAPDCERVVPLCRCTVPRPMVERRNRETGERFWGCQRYGMDTSCETTKPMDGPLQHGAYVSR